MYAAIRQAKAKTGMAEELARRIKEGAIPIISDVEGFMAYYVVYASDDTVTAISLFNNFAGAEEANRRALAWIDQNLGPLLVGPATAVAGPVIVHTLASPWDRRIARRPHRFAQVRDRQATGVYRPPRLTAIGGKNITPARRASSPAERIDRR